MTDSQSHGLQHGAPGRHKNGLVGPKHQHLGSKKGAFSYVFVSVGDNVLQAVIYDYARKSQKISNDKKTVGYVWAFWGKPISGPPPIPRRLADSAFGYRAPQPKPPSKKKKRKYPRKPR